MREGLGRHSRISMRTGCSVHPRHDFDLPLRKRDRYMLIASSEIWDRSLLFRKPADGGNDMRKSAKPGRTTLFRRPGFLVRRLHQIYVAIYFQNCERFGTTPVQSSVMQVLMSQPGMDQVALAGGNGR